jgi:CRP/FNR family cyclic AMP-dependent transcriptional regulator
MLFPSRQRTSASAPRPSKASSRIHAFDVHSFLHSVGLWRKLSEFRRGEIIFSQGDAAKNVMFIQEGSVKLTVVNAAGKEAVVAMVGPGDFLGEACLAGHPIRMARATAIAPTTVLVIDKDEMLHVLHGEHEFFDRFLAYLLARNTRVEGDLIDQLFNSSEKRLARTLLLLAHYGERGRPQGLLPRVSQDTLAEMIGTTRSRVNFFLNKFRKLGFIEYGGRLRGVQVNKSLLSVVLHG